MKRLIGVVYLLAMTGVPAAWAAEPYDGRLYAPAPFILVPDCTQNAPPLGVACIPRAGAVAPNPSTVRASVDLDRQSLRRPYRQLFNWGP